MRIPHSLLSMLLLLWCPAGAVRLLAIMPMSDSFQEAVEGMKSDLGKDYQITAFDVQGPNPAEALLRIHKSTAPDGLILMDSKAINLVEELKGRDSALAKIPKFVLMTLKAEQAVKGLENVAGIRFEVPAYTIFTNLQAITRKDFRKIGVFHRRSFSGFVEESKRFLAKEKMELIGQCLDCGKAEVISQDEVLDKLRAGLDEMRKQKVEIVWMLADNLIVNRVTLKRFWMGRFKESRLPLVVPLANMVSLESNLGFFAAFPDYTQLGAQAAQQVIQVFESKEDVSRVGFEPLVSIQMTVNADMARRAGWELREDKLSQVKTVLRKD
ncbi:MAG TPA: hypothetical protein VJ385_08315 [Fibrobacteria bacterium]|nr:hypothetical protein [Fibrobacteria bacterium]